MNLHINKFIFNVRSAKPTNISDINIIFIHLVVLLANEFAASLIVSMDKRQAFDDSNVNNIVSKYDVQKLTGNKQPIYIYIYPLKSSRLPMLN